MDVGDIWDLLEGLSGENVPDRIWYKLNKLNDFSNNGIQIIENSNNMNLSQYWIFFVKLCSIQNVEKSKKLKIVCTS